MYLSMLYLFISLLVSVCCFFMMLTVYWQYTICWCFSFFSFLLETILYLYLLYSKKARKEGWGKGKHERQRKVGFSTEALSTEYIKKVSTEMTKNVWAAIFKE